MRYNENAAILGMVGIVLLIGGYFILTETDTFGLAVAIPVLCSETDGGHSIFVQGTASLSKAGAPTGTPKTDTCIPGVPPKGNTAQKPAKFTEYNCGAPNTKGSQKIVPAKGVCPDIGCTGGACHTPGTPGAFPENATCLVDTECSSGICNQNTHKCFKPAPLNARCARNEECLSKYCSPSRKVCAATNLSNNKQCFDNEQCAGGKCKILSGTTAPVCCTSLSDEALCQREHLGCFDFSTSNTAILDLCQDIRKPNCGTCAEGSFCHVVRGFDGKPAGSSCEQDNGCIQETNAQFCARHNSCAKISGTDNCGLLRNVDCTVMSGCSTGGTPAPAGCTPSRKCDGNSNTVLITDANCGQTRIFCLSHGSTCQNGFCVGGSVGCAPAANGPGTLADPTRQDGVTSSTSGGGSLTHLDSCFNSGQNLKEITCVEGFLAYKGIKCDCSNGRCLDAPQPGPAP